MKSLSVFGTFLAWCCLCASLWVSAQDYDGYSGYERDDGGYSQPDNLYHDYAARQQEKGQVGAG